MTPPGSPLRLSYSSITLFQSCPRCWYLREVLGLGDAGSARQRLGTAAHAALERFVRAWCAADAEGGARPGLDELLRLGRAAMVEAGRETRPAAREEQDQLDAQLRMYFERLHDPSAHIVELERWVRCEFVVDGVAHTLSARLDRIDLAGDGGTRLIDYKTGYAKKALLEPSKNDLQMGLYAMMLSQEQGVERLRGTAEYWLLSTGQRGVIGFDALSIGKVRETVERAVRGMLSGRYERGKDCDGECEAFF
jgi:RecB family exonuclease